MNDGDVIFSRRLDDFAGAIATKIVRSQADTNFPRKDSDVENCSEDLKLCEGVAGILERRPLMIHEMNLSLRRTRRTIF